jgi:hypothetical protein
MLRRIRAAVLEGDAFCLSPKAVRRRGVSDAGDRATRHGPKYYIQLTAGMVKLINITPQPRLHIAVPVPKGCISRR